MITESMLYWITRLDRLSTFCEVFAVISGIASAVLFIVLCILWLDPDGGEEPRKRAVKIFLPFFGICLLFTAGNIFVPTTKDMVLIKVVPAIVNSDLVTDQLPKDARKLYQEAIYALEEKLGVQSNERNTERHPTKNK